MGGRGISVRRSANPGPCAGVHSWHAFVVISLTWSMFGWHRGFRGPLTSETCFQRTLMLSVLQCRKCPLNLAPPLEATENWFQHGSLPELPLFFLSTYLGLVILFTSSCYLVGQDNLLYQGLYCLPLCHISEPHCCTSVQDILV